jgi:Virulence factor BrkB
VSHRNEIKLGLTSVIGLAISLWSANAAMKSLFDTLNIVYDEKEKRGFIKLNVMSLTFTIAAIAFVVAALGAVGRSTRRPRLPLALEFCGAVHSDRAMAGHVPGRGVRFSVRVPLRGES